MLYCGVQRTHVSNHVPTADTEMSLEYPERSSRTSGLPEFRIKSANIKRLKYLNFFPFTSKDLEKVEDKYIRIEKVNTFYMKGASYWRGTSKAFYTLDCQNEDIELW